MGRKNQNKLKEVAFWDKIIETRQEYDVIHDKDYRAFFRLTKLDKIKNCTILDAGCGSGILSEKIASFGNSNKLIGVDISPRMVECANNKKIANFTALVGDIENEELFTEGFFDFIIFFGVLHHLPNITKVIRNTSKWLKHGGKLIAFEPNGSNPINYLTNRILLKILLLICEGFVLRNELASVNETHHTVTTYKKVLKNSGFKVMKIIPFLDYHIHPGKLTILKIVTLFKYLLYKVFEIFFSNYYSGFSIILVAEKR